MRIFKYIIKPWLLPLISFFILFILGALGYRITEGWDFGDCLWMVLITITTIGFGEVEPLSGAGRLITFLIIGGGLIVVQLSLKRLLTLSSTGYFRKMQELNLRRFLRKMNNHIIICGFGRIGREIAEQLQNEGINFIIVEDDEKAKEAAELKGMRVLFGDATLNETLLTAGIDQCKSLIAALPSDADNLYVILSARVLNPNCSMISRAETEEASKKLKLAGATTVVSPYVVAGKSMANASINS